MSGASKNLKLIFPTFNAIIEVKRHLSPVIYVNLLVKTPLTTFAYPSKGDLLIKVNIRRGDVQKTPVLTMGDVYYDMIEDALGIVLKNRGPCPRNQIKIGSVVEGLEELKEVDKLTSLKIVTD